MRSRWGLAPYALALGVSVSLLLRMPTTVDGVRYVPLFDDAMISMRYGRNLADGHGLVFNAGGHRIEGFTNLFWTLLMAALHAAPVPTRAIPVVVAVLGIVCVLLTVWLAGRLVELLVPGTIATPIARWLVAGTYALVFWSTIGMEVGLVTVLCLAATFFVLRFNASSRSLDLWCAGAALALAVMTRPDAIVAAMVLIAYCAWTAGRARWHAVGILVGCAGGMLVAVTAWRWAYYGYPAPNTYYLKTAAIPVRTRVVRGLSDLVTLGLGGLFVPVLLASAALWLSPRRRAYWLLGALVIAQCVYAVSVGGDTYDLAEGGSRYVAIVLPQLAVLAAIGISNLPALLRSDRRRVVVAGGAALGAVLLLRVANFRPGKRLQVGAVAPNSISWRIFLPVAFAAAIWAVWKFRTMVATVAVVAISVLALMTPHAFDAARNRSASIIFDKEMTRTAIAIRNATDPRAVVATGAAGQIGYYSERPIVDVLGYSDDVIAHSKPSLGRFVPGHDKFNLRYSIGSLHPDVVAVLFIGFNDRDAALIESFGYERLATQLFVRIGSPYVDRDRLARETAAGTR